MIDHDLDPRPREGQLPDDDPGVGGPIRVGLENQLEVTELPFGHEKSPVPTSGSILATHESTVFDGPDRWSLRSVLPVLREGAWHQRGAADPQRAINAGRCEPSGQIPTVEEPFEPFFRLIQL